MFQPQNEEVSSRFVSWFAKAPEITQVCATLHALDFLPHRGEAFTRIMTPGVLTYPFPCGKRDLAALLRNAKAEGEAADDLEGFAEQNLLAAMVLMQEKRKLGGS